MKFQYVLSIANEGAGSVIGGSFFADPRADAILSPTDDKIGNSVSLHLPQQLKTINSLHVYFNNYLLILLHSSVNVSKLLSTTFFDFCFQTINCFGPINFFFTSSHNPVLHIIETSDITTQGTRYIIS